MAVPKFKNETTIDFSKPANRKKQQAALDAVRAAMGKEYPILIGKEEIFTDQKLNSYNPSKSTEVVGVFQKGDAAIASKAMDVAVATFETWKNVPYKKRAEYLFKAAKVMRKHRFELNAVEMLEVGKTLAGSGRRCRRGDRLPGVLRPGDAPLRRRPQGREDARRKGETGLHPARRGRGHPAVEFPAGDSGGDDLRRARHRQHRGAETLERLAAGSAGSSWRSCGRWVCRREW